MSSEENKIDNSSNHNEKKNEKTNNFVKLINKPLPSISSNIEIQIIYPFNNEQQDSFDNCNNNDNNNNIQEINDGIKNEASIWVEYYSMASHYYHSLLSCNQLLFNIREILNKMVDMEYIDWAEISPFKIEGRIYERHDYAEFRCEVFKLQNNENNDNNHQSIVQMRRIFGDGWIFEEFRAIFAVELSKNHCIVDNGNDDNNINDMRNSDNDNDDDSYDTYNNDNIPNGTEHVIFTIDEAKQLLFEATDENQERDTMHENLLSLYHAINDTKKIKIFNEIEDIIYQLLHPIIGENQIYDTWIIKRILEIIAILIQYNCNSNENNSNNDNNNNNNHFEWQQDLALSPLPSNLYYILYKIKEQWTNITPHPLGLTYFYPSQQIVRLCNLQLQYFH